MSALEVYQVVVLRLFEADFNRTLSEQEVYCFLYYLFHGNNIEVIC